MTAIELWALFGKTCAAMLASAVLGSFAGYVINRFGPDWEGDE